MNLGIKILTWLKGNLVGIDDLGNKYYCDSKNFNLPNSKRWVIFKDEVEASNIPPHWHAWLHKTVEEPPLNYSHKYPWQKDHTSNLTGTSDAYYPESHPLSKSKDKKEIEADYEQWKP